MYSIMIIMNTIKDSAVMDAAQVNVMKASHVA